MERMQKILVGVDYEPSSSELSPGSRVAARRALWLGERTGGRVDFLHSTFTDELDAGSADADLLAGRIASVEKLRAEHAGVETGELQLSEQRPWMVLTRRALAGEADVVVVATRSRRAEDGRNLGSVTLRLQRQCPAPVWAVKPDYELEHRCVLAATDLSPVGDRATRYGAFVARAYGAPLVVVHAWQVPMELQLSAARLGDAETGRRKQAVADAATEHIHRVLAEDQASSEVDVRVACDAPSHLIMSAVQARHPDLVVMGTLSRGGVAGMLVGNTAERLLTRLECSILTVKPDDFVCPVAP